MSPLIYGGAERYILLGLNAISELCSRMIDYYGFKKAEDDRESIRILADNKVYPEWLSENLSEHIKYISQPNDNLELMDKSELYKSLGQTVSDFRHFKKYLQEFQRAGVPEEIRVYGKSQYMKTGLEEVQG